MYFIKKFFALCLVLSQVYLRRDALERELAILRAKEEGKALDEIISPTRRRNKQGHFFRQNSNIDEEEDVATNAVLPDSVVKVTNDNNENGINEQVNEEAKENSNYQPDVVNGEDKTGEKEVATEQDATESNVHKEEDGHILSATNQDNSSGTNDENVENTKNIENVECDNDVADIMSNSKTTESATNVEGGDVEKNTGDQDNASKNAKPPGWLLSELDQWNDTSDNGLQNDDTPDSGNKCESELASSVAKRQLEALTSPKNKQVSDTTATDEDGKLAEFIANKKRTQKVQL